MRLPLHWTGSRHSVESRMRDIWIFLSQGDRVGFLWTGSFSCSQRAKWALILTVDFYIRAALGFLILFLNSFLI